MVASTTVGGCWPAKQHEQLLRAALLEGEDSVKAWEIWESSVDIDHLDSGSVQILPQLYRNLQRQGIEHPLMMKFKGVYRNTWYKNQILFYQIAALLRSFHEAGIKTLLLHGASLVLVCYKDFGLRLMTDFGVLIPTKEVSTATVLLRSQNWISEHWMPELLSETFLCTRNSRQFKDQAGHEIDLRWHVLRERCQPGADDDFWEAAMPVRSHGLVSHVLNPADQLLYVCVHGAEWNPAPSLLWVADAMAILKRSPGIDWNRLVLQSQKLHFVLHLRGRLSYLYHLLRAPIPSVVLQCLNDISVSQDERAEYEAMTGQPNLPRQALLLWLRCKDYFRSLNGIPARHKLIGFPGFLREVWGIPLWEVPFYGVYKVTRKILKR